MKITSGFATCVAPCVRITYVALMTWLTRSVTAVHQAHAQADRKKEEQLQSQAEDLRKAEDSLRTLTASEAAARNASMDALAQVVEVQETLRAARENQGMKESEELSSMHARMMQASSVIQQLNARIAKQMTSATDAEHHKNVLDARIRHLQGEVEALQQTVAEEKRAVVVTRDLHARSVALLSSERQHAEKHKRENERALREANEQIAQLRSQTRKQLAQIKEMETLARAASSSSSSSSSDEEEDEGEGTNNTFRRTQSGGQSPATLKSWLYMLWLLTLKLGEADAPSRIMVDADSQTDDAHHQHKHKGAEQAAAPKVYADAGVQTQVEEGKRKSIEEDFWNWMVIKAEKDVEKGAVKMLADSQILTTISSVLSEKAIVDFADGERFRPLMSLSSFLWMWMITESRDKDKAKAELHKFISNLLVRVRGLQNERRRIVFSSGQKDPLLQRMMMFARFLGLWVSDPLDPAVTLKPIGPGGMYASLLRPHDL